jgi:hypothetical protein
LLDSIVRVQMLVAGRPFASWRANTTYVRSISNGNMQSLTSADTARRFIVTPFHARETSNTTSRPIGLLSPLPPPDVVRDVSRFRSTISTTLPSKMNGASLRTAVDSGLSRMQSQASIRAAAAGRSTSVTARTDRSFIPNSRMVAGSRKLEAGS